jgi:hypothetical protein
MRKHGKKPMRLSSGLAMRVRPPWQASHLRVVLLGHPAVRNSSAVTRIILPSRKTMIAVSVLTAMFCDGCSPIVNASSKELDKPINAHRLVLCETTRDRHHLNLTKVTVVMTMIVARRLGGACGGGMQGTLVA